MQPREFVRRVPETVRAGLPATLASFRSSAGFSMAQLWYGNRALHYEAWIRSRLDVIELGLHFEADPLTNARLLAAFHARERTVRRALGPAVRIESWDKGWARVWEPVSLGTLDAALLERVAARLADYIVGLEPALRDEVPADVAWSEPRTSGRPTTQSAERMLTAEKRRRPRASARKGRP